MIFTKEELSFLDLYSMYVDSSLGSFGDKVIISKYDGEILFTQKGRDDILFIKRIPREVEEFQPIIYETNKLNQIIRSLPDKSEITIDGTKISVSDTISYEFESYDYSVDTNYLDDMMKLVLNFADKSEQVQLVDVDRISNVQPFMGEKLFPFENFDNLNLIAFFSGYYVASDRYHVTAASGNASKIDKDFYFHSIVYSVCKYLNEKDAQLFIYKTEEEDNSKCVMTFEDLSVIFPHTESSRLPNILTEDTKSFYEHETFIIIDKALFLNVLQRIMIITNAELKDRVFITLSKDKMVIESKDNGKAREVLPIEESNIENDISLILSSRYLAQTSKFIEDQKLKIKVPNTEEGVAIKVQGKDTDKKFYVVNLLDDFE